MKLITETVQDINILTETKDGQKHYFIEGVFMQAEAKNRNGRVYPMPVMEKELDRYNKEYVKTSRAMGELGHPEGPTVKTLSACPTLSRTCALRETMCTAKPRS